MWEFYQTVTARSQACGWWLPFHAWHTCSPYHLPKAGPDLFSTSPCPLSIGPICFPGGALLCITLPVRADKAALCAFPHETDGKEGSGRHLRRAVAVSAGAGCDGLVERGLSDTRAVPASRGPTGADRDPATRLLCGELQEQIKGCPAGAQERKRGKTKLDEVTFPSRSGAAWLLASRTSLDARDDLQTSHLLGNGLDTRPHINSYCNRAQCQGLRFSYSEHKQRTSWLEHSI